MPRESKKEPKLIAHQNGGLSTVQKKKKTGKPV